MKKQILLAGLVLFSVISTQSSAFAEDWFKKYDHDGDKRWNYDEFARAQREWQIAHHEHEMSERELHDYYERYDKNHNGYWGPEEARRAHHW